MVTPLVPPNRGDKGGGEHPVLVGDIFRLDFPDRGGPLLQLSDGILGRFIHGQAGGEGHPTAAGRIGMANGFRVCDNRVHIFRPEAQYLGRNHGARGPAAADIG